MKTQKGFTLIELAVVIAIIAVLAAVALPRFGDTTAQAELSNIKDLKSQLASAAGIYTAEQAATPTDFASYVDNNATATTPKTIALGKFGSTNGGCSASGTTITCADGTFKKWTGVKYTYTDGVVTGTASGTLGGKATTVNF